MPLPLLAAIAFGGFSDELVSPASVFPSTAFASFFFSASGSTFSSFSSDSVDVGFTFGDGFGEAFARIIFFGVGLGVGFGVGFGVGLGVDFGVGLGVAVALGVGFGVDN